MKLTYIICFGLIFFTVCYAVPTLQSINFFYGYSAALIVGSNFDRNVTLSINSLPVEYLFYSENSLRININSSLVNPALKLFSLHYPGEEDQTLLWRPAVLKNYYPKKFTTTGGLLTITGNQFYYPEVSIHDTLIPRVFFNKSVAIFNVSSEIIRKLPRLNNLKIYIDYGNLDVFDLTIYEMQSVAKSIFNETVSKCNDGYCSIFCFTMDNRYDNRVNEDFCYKLYCDYVNKKEMCTLDYKFLEAYKGLYGVPIYRLIYGTLIRQKESFNPNYNFTFLPSTVAFNNYTHGDLTLDVSCDKQMSEVIHLMNTDPQQIEHKVWCTTVLHPYLKKYDEKTKKWMSIESFDVNGLNWLI